MDEQDPENSTEKRTRLWPERLRDAVWLSYVRQMTGLHRPVDLDNRYCHTPGRSGPAKDQVRVFGRVAAGTRAPPYATVRQVEKDAATSGTRDVFDAQIWKALLQPSMTMDEASRDVASALAKFELRRSTPMEASLLSVLEHGLTGASLAMRVLSSYFSEAEPVAVISLLAVLHREADLASCTPMAEALLREIDIRTEVFLLHHLGYDDWQDFPRVSQALRYAFRPARSVEDCPAIYAEHLLTPLVPQNFSVEIGIGISRNSDR